MVSRDNVLFLKSELEYFNSICKQVRSEMSTLRITYGLLVPMDQFRTNMKLDNCDEAPLQL